MPRKPGPLTMPHTHDPRPGMGTVEEMWRYRLAQRVMGMRLMGWPGSGDPDGFSQGQLALRVGVAKSVICRIEAGEGCNGDTLIRLAQVFGVSIDFLIGRDRTPKADHELVDEAYERLCSLASSLDYAIENPHDMSIRNLMDTVEMVARARRDLVDLTFRLRHPDPDNLGRRVPSGYEFVRKMEKKIHAKLE